MGQEARCQARLGGKWQDVSALLEEKDLVIKGAPRVRVPIGRMERVKAEDGVLSFRLDGEEMALRLGAQAEKWKERILHPPSRLDKLGVKDGMKIAVLGLDDAAFAKDLKARGATVASGRAAAGTDMVFLACRTRADLKRLPALAAALKPEGSIWVLWRKGGPDMKEQDVRDVMDGPGLVDVKVVSFSDTLSGLKLMIRRERRPAAAGRRRTKEA
jgi:hypothetical protein